MTIKSPLWRVQQEGLRTILAQVIVLALVIYIGFPNRLDHVLYDAGLNWMAPGVADEVALVAIDNKSLRELGRWPWSRDVHARFVERMTQVGAKAVTIDIALNESSALDPAGDARLAYAIERSAKVVLPVYPESSLKRHAVSEALPMPSLRNLVMLGHSDLEIETEGTSRGIYLKAGSGAARYPALAMAALEVGQGPDPARYVGARNGHINAADPNAWVRDYYALVPFAGPPGTFVPLSLVDVLASDAVANTLSGKFVMLGVTAEGLRSTLLTPMAQGMLMSGLEYQGTVLNALLQNRLIVPLVFPVHMVLAALCILIPLLIYTRMSVPRAWWVFLGLCIAFGAAWLGTMRMGHWFPPSAVFLVLATGFVSWAWRKMESTSRSLQREQERARATLMSVGDGVLTTDRAWRIQYMNPASQQLLGARIHEVKGMGLIDLLRFGSTADKHRLEGTLERCARQWETISPGDPFMLSRGQGRPRALRITVSPISAREVEEEQFVIALSDISDSVEMAQQMAFQATHDALTGLPNRTLLTDRIRHAINAARRNGESVAGLFFDLDGFKRVNDTLGHTAGDELIKEVARRLSSRRRESDTVARWGGDEFVILMTGFADESVIVTLVEEIQAMLRIPFTLNGSELHLSASIGVAVFPKDGQDAETLLKRADMAMYEAKREGRNQLRFYAEHIDEWSRRHLETEAQLHRALKNDEFVVHYQPQVSLATGHVVGLEALIRWRHPEKGLLLPSQFLPIAEESTLIEAIGERVMQIAFTQAHAWSRDKVPFVSLSINFSPRQFMRPNLVEKLDRIMQETGMSPHHIKAEVTETLVVSDREEVGKTLRAIRDRGIRLVLDDFGTGYSSLDHLKRLPVDELKIDKIFTRDIARRSQDAAITEAFITLAHKMNMRVVAEGVETLSQVELLRRQHCDEVQGYYLSESVAAEDIPAAFTHIASIKIGQGRRPDPPRRLH